MRLQCITCLAHLPGSEVWLGVMTLRIFHLLAAWEVVFRLGLLVQHVLQLVAGVAPCVVAKEGTRTQHAKEGSIPQGIEEATCVEEEGRQPLWQKQSRQLW